MSRSVVLIGGGHAHVEVVRRFGEDPIPNVALRVFDPNPRPVYSGMVPGFVAGQYPRTALQIDLGALCARCGASYEEAAVERVDAGKREIILADGSVQGFDLASLDIGSTVAGLDAPGVREHALPSRPIARLIAEVEALIASLVSKSDDERPVHVVGAGAAGVELAFCLEARLAEHGRGRISLVTADDRVLAGAHASARRRVVRALARRRIEVRTGARVAALESAALVLESGARLPSAAAVWVTGAAAHDLAGRSCLPCDTRGFVCIGATLQIEGEPNMFAVGDCASLPGVPKAGVYAVRMGPLLDANMRARLQGAPLRAYTPQRDFLSLLNLGNGTAIGTKWGVALEGRPLMWLKDRIDRAFMERYR